MEALAQGPEHARIHAMPCHHALAETLRAYIDAAAIAEDRKGWLFRTALGTKTIRCPSSP
jgi:hypothetical protein